MVKADIALLYRNYSDLWSQMIDITRSFIFHLLLYMFFSQFSSHFVVQLIFKTDLPKLIKHFDNSSKTESTLKLNLAHSL